MTRKAWMQENPILRPLLHPKTNYNIAFSDKLVQYYFVDNQEVGAFDQIELFQSKIVMSPASEVVICIEEEMYYNNGECTVDGFVYITKGFVKDMTVTVEEIDCFDVKGYFCAKDVKDLLKNIAIESKLCSLTIQNTIPKDCHNNESILSVLNANNGDTNHRTADGVIHDDISKSTEPLDNAYCQNTMYYDIDEMPDYNCRTNNIYSENLAATKQEAKVNDNCHKNEDFRLIAEKEHNTLSKTKNYAIKDNLFMTYQRKNVNLIDLQYKNGNFILEVKSKIDNFLLTAYLNTGVYDVDLRHTIGESEAKNNKICWKIPSADEGTYELNAIEFGSVKGVELVKIQYECINFASAGVKIVSVPEHTNVYVKTTFKTIKYEIFVSGK